MKLADLLHLDSIADLNISQGTSIDWKKRREENQLKPKLVFRGIEDKNILKTSIFNCSVCQVFS